MMCWRIRARLPGYLDGALAARDHDLVREHVGFCEDCRRDLERYHKLAFLMSRVDRAAPPSDLATRVRVAVSRERAAGPWPQRLWNAVGRTLDNLVRPVALPATGGVMTALIVFVVVMHNLLVGVPLGAVPNDVPTNLIQPARLVSLAPFPVLGDPDRTFNGSTNLLLVEAVVDSRGQMVSYEILSGPDTPVVRRQLDQVLLFSRFRPQMSFGRPTSGGRVVVIFSEIRVEG